MPSGYAPPCVAPWKGGDNGGATAPGVTEDTITVALYQAQPDLLQQAFFEDTGSDESLAKERETTQEYVDYFSAHYELYGRKVELVTDEGQRRSRRRGRGQGRRDQGRHRAARVRVVRRTGPDRRVRRRARGARRALRGRLRDRRSPSRSSSATRRTCGRRLASPEQASEHWAAFVGKQLAKGKAAHARSTQLKAKPRVFGVVHYDDDAGTFAKSVKHFEVAAWRRTA